MGLKRGRERESKVNWWEGKNAVAVGRPSVHPSIGGACFSVASFRFIDDVVVVVVDSLDSPSLRLPLIHLGDSWRNGGNMGTRRRQKEGRKEGLPNPQQQVVSSPLQQYPYHLYFSSSSSRTKNGRVAR